ncbi:putative ZPR1, zinc finger domain-containing protein [Helianthus anomalus]
MTFPSTCGACVVSCETRMFLTSIPICVIICYKMKLFCLFHQETKIFINIRYLPY